MSELQISLLLIGVVVVLALYAYNGWQQWQYRRKFGTAFQPQHADVLVRPAQQEEVADHPSEPWLDPKMEQVLLSEPTQPVVDEICVLLEPGTDYLAMIIPQKPVGADALAQLWEQRFDFGKSIQVCGRNATSGQWEKVIADSRVAYAEFKLALQLVNRSGAVTENRLLDFRDVVRRIAMSLRANMTLPDVAQAAVCALELDKFCADMDQMIGLNIVPSGKRILLGPEIARVAEQQGLSLQADGAFHMLDTRGHTLFSLGSQDNTPFQHHTLPAMQITALTLLLDVPRVELPTQRFDQMVALAQQLASDLRAVIMDDHQVALSQAGMLLIREQIATIETHMLAGNIIPGSSKARRLFS
ncbi:MAG: cell division protein ZipA C-terminal FtsZ-binding domain-containing protein [Gallionellaceae bacterium]|nr:cell division protein ZipA C-terminal FtsZ-binding domain-containing protein [Gallionellaceae bacterium]